MYDSFSGVFLASFLLPVIVHSCVTLTSDAAVLQSYVLKGLLYVSALTLFIQTFIRDLANDDMGLHVYPICVLFCTDSRRMMLVCSLNLALFYGKYLAQIAAGLIKQRTRFVMIRIPLSITPETLTAGQDDMIPSPRRIQLDRGPSGLRIVPSSLNPALLGHGDDSGATSEDTDSRRGTFARPVESTDSLRLSRVSTAEGVGALDTKAGVARGGTSPRSNTFPVASPTHLAETVQSSASNLGVQEGAMYLRLTARVHDTIRLYRLKDLARSVDLHIHRDALMCVAKFDPLIRHPWAARLAQSRYYQMFMLVWVITAVAITATSYFSDQVALNWILVLIGVVLFGFEMTRFDRNLTLAVMSRFEWIILFGSTVQMCVFAPWAQVGKYAYWANLPVFIGYSLVVGLVLGLSDAAPTYPYYIRVTGASLLFFNTVRTLIQNYFAPYYFEYPVCFIFCSDTAVLSLSPTATCAIFLGKYVYSLVRFPRRCIIASTHLHFSLGTTNRIRHMSETSVLRSEAVYSVDGERDDDLSPRSQSKSAVSNRSSVSMSALARGSFADPSSPLGTTAPSLQRPSSTLRDRNASTYSIAAFPLTEVSADQEQDEESAFTSVELAQQNSSLYQHHRRVKSAAQLSGSSRPMSPLSAGAISAEGSREVLISSPSPASSKL